MFMRDVLHYDLDTSGILAAFPYILMAVVVQVILLLHPRRLPLHPHGRVVQVILHPFHTETLSD